MLTLGLAQALTNSVLREEDGGVQAAEMPSACAEMGLAKALTKSVLREEDGGVQAAEEFSLGVLAVSGRTRRLVQPTDCGRWTRDPCAELWSRVLTDSEP